MARMTLLQIVQNVLLSMEADNVNSLSGTVESAAIAETAREVYYEMMSQGDWPHLVKTTQLISVSDNEKPNYLEIPENYQDIRALFYNNIELEYMEPMDFIKSSIERNQLDENIVQVISFNGVQLNVFNNETPRYFTIFEDKYVITEAWDQEQESTLQGINSIVTASVLPEWETREDYVPEMTDQMFPTYLALVKRAAFLYFRREASAKDERQALAGMGRLRLDVNKLYRKENEINYGRKR